MIWDSGDVAEVEIGFLDDEDMWLEAQFGVSQDTEVVSSLVQPQTVFTVTTLQR